MSRIQKILLTVVLLELAGMGLVWRWRARPGPLPPVDWSGIGYNPPHDSSIKTYAPVSYF